MANTLIIREICTAKKITIRALAKKLGMAECTIQTIIRTGATSVSTLERIADALGISPAMFYIESTSDIDLLKLKQENDYLKQLINEKERTINILLKDKTTLEPTGTGTKSGTSI